MAENVNTANKPVKKSWFKGVKSEFKKITWPDKPTLFKESLAVTVISVVLSLVIALLDLVIKYGIQVIGIG